MLNELTGRFSAVTAPTSCHRCDQFTIDGRDGPRIRSLLSPLQHVNQMQCDHSLGVLAR